jgi:hypothetical protein
MARKKGRASRHRSDVAQENLTDIIHSLRGGQYPPEEERWEIIERRQAILRELIKDMVTNAGENQVARANSFLDHHDQIDVLMALNAMTENLSRAGLLLDHARVYREYRRAFARYGGERRFLRAAEFEELNVEYVKMSMKREMLPVIKIPASKREKELRDLVLSGHNLWEDITPPAVPPRPADFQAAEPGVYTPPAQNLLSWGWEIDRRRVTKAVAGDRKRWLAAVPDLQRMALDEGLLSGWPGEAASWAPEQALDVMTFLKVSEGTAALATLADRPEDWLSDKLAEVYAAAGPSVEEELAEDFANPAYSENRRQALLGGLHALAENYPARREAIIRRLADSLDANPVEQAKLNGYIIHVLDQLEGVEAADAVRSAFKEDRVDTGIIEQGDIEWL